MRLLLAALLVSLPAAAQISGALTASGDGGDVHLTLDLQCAPACSPASSAIEWRFSALDGGGQVLATAALDGGHFETDAHVTQLGTALTFMTSASCTCGTLDGGVLELSSAPFPIAPALDVVSEIDLPSALTLTVQGFPQGRETIELTYAGAGLDGGLTITHAGADFTGGHSLLVLRPTEDGELVISATLKPWGAQQTSAVTAYTPKSALNDVPHCAVTPQMLVLGALALLIRRPRRT